jgi:protein-disulfide isomerase
MGEKMATSSKGERVLSMLVAISALSVAASVVYRTFVAPAPVAAEARDPEFLDKWTEALSFGIRVGPPRAKVTIVDVADFECPVCRGFYLSARAVQESYPESVALIHVDYPLGYHKFAMPAAKAAQCADRLGAFSQFIDGLYRKQDSLGLKSWGSYAHEAGIADTAAIARCATDPATVSRIQRGIAFGEAIGLSGTPTVLINGWWLPVPPSEERLRALVEAVLAGENPFK